MDMNEFTTEELEVLKSELELRIDDWCSVLEDEPNSQTAEKFLKTLRKTYETVKYTILQKRRDKYVEQLWQFKEYLDKSAASDNEREFQAWTEKPFIISHGDHTVTVENGAEVYNHLTDMLQDEIDDWS